MKKLVFFFLTIACAGIMAFSFSELPIGADMPMADVKMKDVSGTEVSLKEAMKEHGLLVMFSCNTCPYVIKNQKRTRDICNFALSKNIGVILLNANEGQRNGDDSFEAMKQYARQQQYNWYYAVDKNNGLANAFAARRTPECFLFNKEGKLVYKGAIDDNPGNEKGVQRAHLRLAIEEMLAGKDVSVNTTRSVGCTIKRI